MGSGLQHLKFATVLSRFFCFLEMGSNASKPPAPASRLSNEEMQELAGRLVSMLPAPPMAPPPEVVPEPVFPKVAPVPTPPQQHLQQQMVQQHLMQVHQQILQQVQRCQVMRASLKHMSEFVSIAVIPGSVVFPQWCMFQPSLRDLSAYSFFLQFYFFLAPVEAFVAPFFS